MKIIIAILTFILFSNCAGFRGKTKTINESEKLSIVPLKIQYTGFRFFEKEKEVLHQKIISSGFQEEPLSKFLLEIILEEKPSFKKNQIFQFSNFLITFFSGSIIPYHITTTHRIKFRIREEGKNISEWEFETNLHQYRGILMIFLSPFYWPSKEFRGILLETWSKIKKDSI